MQKPPSPPLHPSGFPVLSQAAACPAGNGSSVGTASGDECGRVGDTLPRQPQTAALTWLQPPRTKSGRWESPSEGGEREHSHGNVDGDREWSHSSSPSGCPLPGLRGFPAAPGYKSPLSERGTGAAPARTRCLRATARPFRRDPEGPSRDLHRHTLGTWYSTIPCCRGMGKAGAMALSPCSATAFPWDRTLGTGQVANRMGHKARCQRGVGSYCETRRGQK